jgi:hypothetical protein
VASGKTEPQEDFTTEARRARRTSSEKPSVNKPRCRDARQRTSALVDQLRTLDTAGVEGAFIMTFVSPTSPHNDNPALDLDMNSYSLVKTYEGNRHGATYPDLPWEPKKSFHAVAELYGHL